ncbi:MAG: DUF4838 domain-containing protein [Melioribacter sp.]|uniref:DUF4838 domain-containing protein n=1 Tax=Rosettibacter primus TaxID=3111523 RepID=UPI00247D4FED|nr:DUF4838 domain-containing protein [Melioribacter sp.]
MNYKILPIYFFISLTLFAQTEKLNLTVNGKSEYQIVLSDSASHWDSLTAQELKKYIEKISGAIIPIVSDAQPMQTKEIIIGKNNRSVHIDNSSIKYDGFIIKTEGEKLYFIGGKEKGTLNAVYSFLEKYLNCRMYSASVQIIPYQSTITLPQINTLENPAFEYRDIHYYETTKDEYCRWHKLVDSHDKKQWGMFVHTFQTLVPPDKYFDSHPEYFALRGNIRVREQLCLSNPEVLKIVINELRRRMTENPQAKIWSVSQNDNYSYCQCPECSKIDEQEGSPSGSIINFVNKIAREFPDKIISTLAYQYSRKAPKNIKPEKNVNIMLCSIECNRTKPLDVDPNSASFVNDLIEWSKITDNIFLWDYVVQFSNLISPFPNFQVLQPNIQLFVKHNIKMIFQQGAGKRCATEFGELRTYLIAKLLWDPNTNVDSVMNDFLYGYYGPAGEHIREYIDLMRNELIKSGHDLWIYSNPVVQMNYFLTPELMKRYKKIFDEAEKTVKDQEDFLKRVKIARLPLIYAELEQAKATAKDNNILVIKKNKNKYETNPFIISLLNEFENTIKDLNNVFIHEHGLTAEIYISRYKSILSKTMYNPIALNKPVIFLTEPNWKYPANRKKSLTDGLRGDEDHLFNWVGYEGNDMEVIVDLQKNQTIRKISIAFLQNVFSWIFLPEKVEISISKDGNNFNTISVIPNTISATRKELESPIHAFIKDFTCQINSVKTRFVKIKATSIKTCPRWHPGYPDKAWIFTDEIIIE